MELNGLWNQWKNYILFDFTVNWSEIFNEIGKTWIHKAACELNVRPSIIIWSMIEGLKQASGKTDGKHRTSLLLVTIFLTKKG